eukprot:TRINITY_DN1223_c0_g1_i10.p1 TRINITY_DN1223_c0_g1~~TRINITY_DN1223_c0_g1_i10.p1  ORF type:complete len:389 (-),score=139.10 TRINITY_DN1223_c0_g1_i10:97-1227(-)
MGQDLDFFVPFVKEITNHYQHYNKRFSIADVMTILRKVTSIRLRSPFVYNQILGDIGRLFNSIRMDERQDIIEAFVRIRIKQTDLFDKLLVKVFQEVQQRRGKLLSLIRALYQIGYDSEEVKRAVPQLLERLDSRRSFELLEVLRFVPILQLSNEAELLSRLEEVNIEPQNLGIEYTQFGEYLRLVYRDNQKLYEKVKSFHTNYDENLAKISSQSETKPFVKETLVEYLKAMKVNASINHKIDGFTVDLFIPDKKLIVNIHTQQDLNFDKFSLTGKAVIHKRIIESFQKQGYKVATVNWVDFSEVQEHLTRVSYLVSAGIESNNQGTYDFSNIKLEESRKKENREAEAVEADEGKADAASDRLDLDAEEDDVPKKN